jgi:hypothetical protein
VSVFTNNAGVGVLGPSVGVFNMVPPAGVAARLGFNVAGTVVTLDGGVRGDGVYRLTAHLGDVSEGLALAGSTLTLWGVPADKSHNSVRACPGEYPPWNNGPVCTTEATPRAFLRNPTACTAPGEGLPTTLTVDSWANPGVFTTATSVSHDAPGFPAAPSEWGTPVGPTGCDLVPFAPTLAATPALPAAGGGSPIGFDLTVPQSDDPNTIGTSDLRKVVVALPAGVRLNPSSAGGLGACSPTEIGLLGTHFPAPDPIRFTEAQPSCPEDSKLGTVTIHTPLLEEPLTGSIYLAAPHENPFGTLVAIYLVAKGPGTLLKLAGRVDLDPVTGQVTSTFEDQPQLPFSTLHLEFKQGPRAAFSMPPGCGTYTTHAVLGSWSGKTVTSDSAFTVSGDGYGAPCEDRFAPALSAGTTTPAAGAFSPFGLQLSRADSEGELQALSSLKLPPGLLADAASVPVRCTDAQAAAAACPAASRIGSITVGAGAGPDPYYVTGDVYFTGPYEGRPFGLAFVVHALAGPFDLGNVVVRAAVQINNDGSVTTTSDPFPQILDGIPLQLRDIRVSLDRPGFMLNPTNCQVQSITGTALSTAGQSAPLSESFEVGGCRNLGFKPSFRATTVAKTSRANGAALHVTVTSGPGQANIGKVDSEVPQGLAVRDSTLNQACTEKQFAANPAGCPAGSFVGTAIARTPLLASALTGPAIFVSHGGREFPDLDIVLQGEGVKVVLTGKTLVKGNRLISHFDTVPDAPVTRFDLTLPQGPHSALAASANLCTKQVGKRRVRRTLIMPTTITGQNGAVIRRSTKVSVSGCGKPAKPHTKRK